MKRLSRSTRERVVGLGERMAVLTRILFGVMFTLTGVLWFRRDDSVSYMTDSFARVSRLESPDGLYDEFLVGFVLERPELFVFMVGTGELLSGLALLVGHPSRAGAVGAIFLTVNYGIAFANPLVPPAGNFLLALLLVPMLTPWPYRRLVWKRRLGVAREAS